MKGDSETMRKTFKPMIGTIEFSFDGDSDELEIFVDLKGSKGLFFVPVSEIRELIKDRPS